MNHLPYIVASYGLFLLVSAWFAIGAATRLTRATRRLRAIDPRAAARDEAA